MYLAIRDSSDKKARGKTICDTGAKATDKREADKMEAKKGREAAVEEGRVRVHKHTGIRTGTDTHKQTHTHTQTNTHKHTNKHKH